MGGAKPSPAAFVLPERIAPKSPPGGARQTPPPRPAPPSPAGAAASRPRGACPLVPAPQLGATEGSGDSGQGGGAIRVRGSLPSPAVPAADRARSDGCSRLGKKPWRGSPAPLLPRPPAPHSATQRNRAEGGVLPREWEAGREHRRIWGRGRCLSRALRGPRPRAGGTEGKGAPCLSGEVAGLSQGRPVHPSLVGRASLVSASAR